jgi:hypothetical protein
LAQNAHIKERFLKRYKYFTARFARGAEFAEIIFLACFFEKEKSGQQLGPAKRDDIHPEVNVFHAMIA